MSQSDYIKYKRTAHILENFNAPVNQKDFPRVFSAQQLTDYKQYSLENTIVNTRTRFNMLVPSGDKIVFSMNLQNATNCGNFAVCNNTDQNPNREEVKTFYNIGLGLPSVSNRTYYTKHPSTPDSSGCYVNNKYSNSYYRNPAYYACKKI